ncbi:uncharacterized protein LOC125682106 [Ostrea edulis]|uniref:uncharacterized protein LOC125682106 n=1 Tax=Ostrea edulis TaxID=37623 RepID=UPI0024AECC8F|nr:uncharacterized protein LOC125682106 [Ostrea edulis]
MSVRQTFNQSQTDGHMLIPSPVHGSRKVRKRVAYQWPVRQKNLGNAVLRSKWLQRIKRKGCKLISNHVFAALVYNLMAGMTCPLHKYHQQQFLSWICQVGESQQRK